MAYLPGVKIIKITRPGEPDTWQASGLCGVDIIDVEITRAQDGFLVKGKHRMTKVKIEDYLVVEDGKVRGEIFWMDKGKDGTPYLNARVDGGETPGGDILS